jgi:hypothetical protein
MSKLAVARMFAGCFKFLRHSAVLARSTFREIFDESAYGRFLERRGISSSRTAYAEFLRETQTARERRPRCC